MAPVTWNSAEYDTTSPIDGLDGLSAVSPFGTPPKLDVLISAIMLPSNHM